MRARGGVHDTCYSSITIGVVCMSGKTQFNNSHKIKIGGNSQLLSQFTNSHKLDVLWSLLQFAVTVGFPSVVGLLLRVTQITLTPIAGGALMSLSTIEAMANSLLLRFIFELEGCMLSSG